MRTVFNICRFANGMLFRGKSGAGNTLISVSLNVIILYSITHSNKKTCYFNVFFIFFKKTFLSFLQPKKDCAFVANVVKLASTRQICH